MALGYKMNKDGSVEKCENVNGYVDCFKNKVVSQTKLRGVFVSTVFLVIDHGYRDFGDKNYKPVLWETMIFGGKNNDYQERYTSLEDAKAGHESCSNSSGYRA